MRIDVYHHFPSTSPLSLVFVLLHKLLTKVDKIMVDQTAQAAALNAQADQVDAVAAQIEKNRLEVNDAIAALTALINAQGGTTPEVDAATARLTAAVAALTARSQQADDDVPAPV